MMRTLVTSIAGSAGRDRLCEHQSNHAGKLRVFGQHNSVVRKQREVQINSKKSLRCKLHFAFFLRDIGYYLLHGKFFAEIFKNLTKNLIKFN